MHIFLYGQSGVGKSTLINQVITRLDLQPKGFITKKVALAEANPLASHRVFLSPWVREPSKLAKSPEAQIVGLTGPQGIIQAYPQVFDDFGVKLLRDIDPQSLVIMDEVGLLEREATFFQKELLHLLTGPYTIIGVIQDKPNVFLDKIKNHPLVITKEVTRANQSQLADYIEKLLISQ